MEEQELFKGYEVRNWDFSPRIYKILAFSAIFNILALLVVAQSNLLTKKGCDSPLVGKVCEVIDTVVVGANVLSTDTAYVDKDYDPTIIEDADIVWVDVTGQDKFNYPEGYFALSNPELLTPQEIPTDPNQAFPNIPGMPGVSSTVPGVTNVTPNPTVGPNPIGPGSNMLAKKPVLPKRQKNPTTGSVDDLLSFEDDKTTKTTPNPTPNPTRDRTAKVTPTPAPSPVNPTTNGPEINKKPLIKVKDDLFAQVKKGELDLSQNFIVVANGVLTKDGKLDNSEDEKTKKKRTAYVFTDGNEKMIAVAKQAIQAVGDSGWLVYLQSQGINELEFTVVQDNDNLQVIIKSNLPTPERAETVTNGVAGLIKTALALDANGLKKLGDDEKLLLSNIRAVINPDKKDQFVLNFALPKPAAQELITRKLNEATEKDQQQKKPNGGNASIIDRNSNTGK